MMVEIACLYTNCDWPSRRSSTQKLSNQLTTPCNFTPLTRNMVSGVLVLRTEFRKVSWRFCFFSADMASGAPYLFYRKQHASTHRLDVRPTSPRPATTLDAKRWLK